MKIFWKMFLSITVTVVAVFCVSGHLLIQKFFTQNLDHTLKQAERVQFIIETSLKEANKVYLTEMNTETDIKNIANSVRFPDAQEVVGIYICNQQGEVIYKSADKKVARPVLQGVHLERDGYQILHQNQTYYLDFVSSIELGEMTVYLESISDITDIFAEKDSQYQSYVGVLLCLILITAVLALVLSYWIATPIKRLSQAAKEVAGGDYRLRMKENGTGEVLQLTRDFNFMTQSLESNIEKLKEENRRREEFVGSFSHEMKTPLTSIIGYADMIRRKPIDDEERVCYANHIYHQGKRLESLSQKMLQLVVANNTQLEMCNIYLVDFFEEILQEMTPLLNRENITVLCSVEDVCIVGDADLLKTVFINFIDNSRKAIGTNGVIRIYTKVGDLTCEIFVSDTGKGIPKEEIAKITECFYMVDKSRQHVRNGVGLGLAICQSILDAHHVAMKIESEEGEGTTVVTEFVLGRAESDEE